MTTLLTPHSLAQQDHAKFIDAEAAVDSAKLFWLHISIGDWWGSPTRDSEIENISPRVSDTSSSINLAIFKFERLAHWNFYHYEIIDVNFDRLDRNLC
jgi:hypothetical protein